jgi:transcriptional regulator with XRE-family HTH domain
MPHAGNLLYKIMLEKRVSQAALARGLNVSDTGVLRYLQQPSLHAAILWKEGKILNHNFFEELSALHPVKKSNAEKEQELADLKKELEIYKRIVEGWPVDGFGRVV